MTLFNCSAYLLSFCPDDLLIGESEIFKPLVTSVLMLTRDFRSMVFFFYELGTLCLVCTFRIVITSCWIFPLPLMNDFGLKSILVWRHWNSNDWLFLGSICFFFFSKMQSFFASEICYMEVEKDGICFLIQSDTLFLSQWIETTIMESYYWVMCLIYSLCLVFMYYFWFF